MGNIGKRKRGEEVERKKENNRKEGGGGMGNGLGRRGRIYKVWGKTKEKIERKGIKREREDTDAVKKREQRKQRNNRKNRNRNNRNPSIRSYT